MSFELLLMRHATAEPGSAGRQDFDRPLDRSGREDARQIGKWVLEHDLLPNEIVSSPALRTRESVREVMVGAGVDEPDVRWVESIYEGSSASLWTAMGVPTDSRRVLLVGHNPGVAMLIEQLAGPGSARRPFGRPIPPGTLALFEVEVGSQASSDEPSGGSAELLHLIRPEDLR
jgi:phosphohistidine phosphatase